ncbi:MAG: hypothetical protein AAGK77_12030 [Pseudomonadota bacterium]
MPKSKKPARKPGDTRIMPTPRQPNPSRKPGHHLRTQIRGGRPPRFPGRTGGR